MSIRDRVDDALLLWNGGRTEGAFLNALVAVAATSRRRFPDRKNVRDGEAFVRFLGESLSVRLKVEYRGECVSAEQIFYKWFRCQLVHERELPVDIKYMADADAGTMSQNSFSKHRTTGFITWLVQSRRHRKMLPNSAGVDLSIRVGVVDSGIIAS